MAVDARRTRPDRHPRYLVEDGFKLLGIVGWLGYLGRVCFRELTGPERDGARSLGEQAVADSGLRPEQARARRVRLELPAEVRHVHAEVVRLLDLPGPQTSWRSWRCVSTLPAWRTRTASSRYSMGVSRTSASPSQTRRRPRSTRRSPSVKVDSPGSAPEGRVPEGDAGAREELADGEGLGDVVVGAGVERRHLVRLRPAGREDDDRDRGPLAQPADDLETVQVGKPEVEDDEVGLPRRGLEQAVLAGLGLDDAIALARQRGAEEAADRRLVLDDQHDRAGRRRTRRLGLARRLGSAIVGPDLRRLRRQREGESEQGAASRAGLPR